MALLEALLEADDGQAPEAFLGQDRMGAPGRQTANYTQELSSRSGKNIAGRERSEHCAQGRWGCYLLTTRKTLPNGLGTAVPAFKASTW